MDFVIELVRKRGKDNLQKFILFIVEIFKRYFITFLYSALSMIIRYGPMVLQIDPDFGIVFLIRYDEVSVEYRAYRQKDGALLAVGSLCDKLRKTEPYKSDLEHMLVAHVFPEFSSPVGHLRAKVCCFKPFIFSVRGR